MYLEVHGVATVEVVLLTVILMGSLLVATRATIRDPNIAERVLSFCSSFYQLY